jgi:hypothetical protein
MPDRTANKATPSTQRYLKISEIRDDCAVMKDGSLRALLLVSSINFALKSEDEQNAIVSGYISFLNSLDSPVQIVIQSRKLNLDNYLANIAKAEKEQTNDLLKIQTAEYRQYITDLVGRGNIMSKRFFVVVPYDPFTNKKRSFWQRSGDVLQPTSAINLNQKQFAERHRGLFVYIDKVLSGLASMGLKASVLDTQSLIELFYNTYNPVISQNEKLADIDKLRLQESAFNL